MKNEVATVTFDYATVDDDSRRKLISHAGDINRQKTSGLKSMLAIGESIADAHELLSNHGDGLFGKWVEAECGITRQSAWRYLNAYKAFGNDCNSLLQTSTAEALYALSSPSAPPGAAKQAKKLADKGVKITEKIAKDLVKDKTPAAKAKPIEEEEIEEDDEPELLSEDSVGQPVPNKLEDSFAFADDFQQQSRALGIVKKWANDLGDSPGCSYLHKQSFVAAIDGLQKQLKFEAPYAVCPYCQTKKKTCEACKGRGFVTKPIYDGAPSELRV